MQYAWRWRVVLNPSVCMVPFPPMVHGGHYLIVLSPEQEMSTFLCCFLSSSGAESVVFCNVAMLQLHTVFRWPQSVKFGATPTEPSVVSMLVCSTVYLRSACTVNSAEEEEFSSSSLPGIWICCMFQTRTALFDPHAARNSWHRPASSIPLLKVQKRIHASEAWSNKQVGGTILEVMLLQSLIVPSRDPVQSWVLSLEKSKQSTASK